MNSSISQADITIDVARLVLEGKVSSITLDSETYARIERSHAYVTDQIRTTDDLFYGINTGFGSLCDVEISKDQIEQLQVNLLRSHACGMGDRVPRAIVRLMLYLKIKSLGAGYSGVSVQLVDTLVAMYNHDILPLVYQLGSLGASGDLSPLAHLALPVIGEGSVEYMGKELTAADAFSLAGIPTHIMQAKEGLALINGTQFSAAYMCYEVIHAQRLLDHAVVIAAMSIEAYQCDLAPYEHYTHQIRRHDGQQAVAQQLYDILKDSPIIGVSRHAVQDPYSFRCTPQVLGSVMAAIDHASVIIAAEINAVTDNPNVFAEADRIISGGNFHAQPLAMVLDYLCIALAEIGGISERRTYKLINGDRGLPVYLTHNAGLESGYMIAQYTAAAIVSQNKQLCTPASVDSIVSSKGQEDHVSMAANAATKCYRVVDNVYRILAVELIVAVRAIECRQPLVSSEQTTAVCDAYRAIVSVSKGDYIVHQDMMAAEQFLREISLLEL